MRTVPVLYFSDILCVWAYIAQLRIDALKARHAGEVAFRDRFCPVFGDTAARIGDGWAGRGGFEGYADHVRQVADGFPEARLDPGVWRRVRPASSLSPHLFLTAVRLGEAAGACPAGAFGRAAWSLRLAFFGQGQDIGLAGIQRDVARAEGLDLAAIQGVLDDGRAHAALTADYKDAEAKGVQGSPSFVLNEGRQTLYGNVGFRILDANIQELLREPPAGEASWC